MSDTHVLTRIFSYRREGHDARLLDRIYRYHVAVLDAIEKGNITEAKETLREHLRASLQERLDTYDRWERQHEMNRLMRLPSQILEELDRMRFGGPGEKNTGERHHRKTGKR